jgi:transcriptional regulator with XRE-family HTH domain
MTHFQEVFIKNLRFFRGKRGISQLKFSEMIDVSPNYLNAVENGKNFPSPAVIQGICDTLEIMPFQLFMEQPLENKPEKQEQLFFIQELTRIRVQFNEEIDEIISKFGGV